MTKRLKTLVAGFTLGAATTALLSIIAKAGSVKNLRSRVGASYREILAESTQAAELRRQELREQLSAMITPPEEN